MNRLIKQAFTLIELLVVIAIIGILSGLIVVSMGGVTDKATIAKSQVFSNSLRNSLMLNIVAQYSFDDIVEYDSGTKLINSPGIVPDSWKTNTGTAYNNPILKDGNDCVSGKCVSFDGVDDYINVNSVDDFNLSKTGQLTVGLWFKTNVINSTAVVQKGSEWMFYPITGNVIGFLVRGTTTWRYSSTYSGVQTNKWYHVVGVATYSGTNLNMDFYLNGKSYGQTNVNTDLGTTTNALTIGSIWTDRFNGSIDDFRVYNATLSVSQIQEQYYAGLNNLLSSGQIDVNEYTERINSIAQQ
ncbi:MAG: LamG-like jellyroll fold domain-containing protein [Candidatus Paceibacterota bacterium]|jgi:prepilin-type N-terminal cleavage/methylation domain-containing protein